MFVQEFGGTLFTVAKDVKIQVEFNPARVRSYRLLGYENRLLDREDFADDRKDAGELGSGHSVTALYEVVPVGARPVALGGRQSDVPAGDVRPGGAPERGAADRAGPVQGSAGVDQPAARRPRARTSGGAASEDMRFASAVAGFALLLRDSEHRGSASFEQVIELARGARGEDPEGYRGEFVGLVETARDLSRPGDDEDPRRPVSVE